MRTEIKKLHGRVGTTIVYVTHDQVEAMTMASRIAVMHKGRIQQFAAPKQVYERPANLFVARFMGSPPMNTMRARLARGGTQLEAVLDGQAGEPIRLPVSAQGAERWVDRDVILGIRPESIVEAGRLRSDRDPRVALVDAEVDVVEPTGAETMVFLRLGGREIIGRIDPDLDPPVGRPLGGRDRHAQGLPFRSSNGGLDRMSEPPRDDDARYPSLSDKVVIVTGGASGIGASFVRHFAANNARVGFLDLAHAEGEALVREIAAAGRPEPLFRPCDLRDIEAVNRALAEIRGGLGRASVLINNAANDQRQRFETVSVEEFDDTIAVNLRHVYFTTQTVVPQMRELGGGSVINLSSIAWMGGGPDLVAYAAAKAGIVGITNSLARALGAANIRVNAIAPGAVLTERQLRLWYADEDQVNAIVSRQCIARRLLEPDIARMALFLGADDSRMVTKQCFVVDAGLR